ncbi:sensor domain-containing diguanylate cyclase [Sulfurimonas sp.]|uniref:sensor domain-containing diguanylate cyclase n=1 Tax=Sulfurimonas sp. TaxID=2022749 RepID=UPI003D0F2668
MDQFVALFKGMSQKSLYEIFETSFDPVAVTDANWEEGLKIIYVNEAFCSATGYSKEEMLGQNPKILQGKESNYKILKELKRELKKGKTFVGQTTNYKKNKTPYFVKWSIIPIKSKEEKILGYISFQKIIDKKNLDVKHDKLLSTIVDISTNLILVTDLEGVIVYINQSFSEKLGYRKEELIGKHSRILKSDAQNKKFYQRMWHSILKKGKFSDIFISRKKDGTLFYDKKDISTIMDDDGNPLYYVSISQDITQQMEKEKQLESKVYTDTLTRLFNRRKYNEIIKEEIERFHKNEKPFSLILIDIDHFKNINDTHGHDIGDLILKELASLLKENIRNEDMAFRWGGEEFVLIVHTSNDIAAIIAEKLRIIIKETEIATLNITASFGIAQITHNMDADTLFSTADKALYKAKKQGRDQVIVL